MTERPYWYWLTGIPGIGPRKTERLLERFGTPEKVFRADPGQLKGIPGITGTDINKICSSRDEGTVKNLYSSLKKQGIRLITRQDEEYPEQLAHIYDAPWVLYVKGKPLQTQYPMVAVVGAMHMEKPLQKSWEPIFPRQVSSSSAAWQWGLTVLPIKVYCKRMESHMLLWDVVLTSAIPHLALICI